MRATIKGASPPELHVQPFGEVGVLVSYTSERRLCAMLEGLVLGTAEHYGEAVVAEEIQCMHRGDAGCVFTVTARGQRTLGEDPGAKRPFRGLRAGRFPRPCAKTGPVTRSVFERLPRGALTSPAPAGRHRGT